MWNEEVEYIKTKIPKSITIIMRKTDKQTAEDWEIHEAKKLPSSDM